MQKKLSWQWRITVSLSIARNVWHCEATGQEVRLQRHLMEPRVQPSRMNLPRPPVKDADVRYQILRCSVELPERPCDIHRSPGSSQCRVQFITYSPLDLTNKGKLSFHQTGHMCCTLFLACFNFFQIGIHYTRTHETINTEGIFMWTFPMHLVVSNAKSQNKIPQCQRDLVNSNLGFSCNLSDSLYDWWIVVSYRWA